MKIDRRLNLVLEIEGEAGPLHVHSTPIDRAVYETYYEPLGLAFDRIFGKGLSATAGPRQAALYLKDAAVSLGKWEGRDGVENGLLNEIRRLTNVIAPGERGWQAMPYHDALRRCMIAADDAAEIENALIFFTLTSCVPNRREVPALLEFPIRLLGGQTTSLNCTEFAASLPISTPDANSGAKVPVLSVPS